MRCPKVICNKFRCESGTSSVVMHCIFSVGSISQVVSRKINTRQCFMWGLAKWRGSPPPPISERKPHIFARAYGARDFFSYRPLYTLYIQRRKRYIAFYDAFLRFINNAHLLLATCEASCASCTRFWYHQWATLRFIVYARCLILCTLLHGLTAREDKMGVVEPSHVLIKALKATRTAVKGPKKQSA